MMQQVWVSNGVFDMHLGVLDCIPNYFLACAPPVGPQVFCLCDIVVGYLCYKILALRGVDAKAATICAW